MALTTENRIECMKLMQKHGVRGLYEAVKKADAYSEEILRLTEGLFQQGQEISRLKALFASQNT